MLKIDKTQFSFFLLWFLIVSICISLGILLANPLGRYLYTFNSGPSSASNDGTAEELLAVMLLVGLFMGFGQWVAINTKIKRSYGWILATLIGFSVGSFISSWIFVRILPSFLQDLFVGMWPNFFGYGRKYYEVYQQVEAFVMGLGICTGTGISTGICQWVALRRNYLSSFKWSAVMTLSFFIGGVLLNFLISLDYRSEAIRLFSITVFSIAVGLISGVFAEPLIIRPESQVQETAI
jgi:hypothetical protein